MKKYGRGDVIREDEKGEWTEGDRQELAEEILSDAPPSQHDDDCDCFRCEMRRYEGNALDC